jgi:PQQ-dependent dehydrogenase (s-GDH family)
MKKTLLMLIVLISSQLTEAQNPVTNNTNDWNVTILISGDSGNQEDRRLAHPNEITFGPDGWLWITERGHDNSTLNRGERIVRVNPNAVTPKKVQMIDLSSPVYQTGGQDGLMGMAIHPDLYTNLDTSTNNYVFVAYTYSTNGSDSGRRARIVRLLYNNSTQTLSPDTSLNANGTIIEGLPASNDHNSGRLIFGPDLKLYYTIGDQGANQFNNRCNPILAQVIPSQAEVNAQDYTKYPGKLLRLNLNGSIPSDNPTFDHDNDGGAVTAEVLSHIYTYGHRNHQGIVFASDGTLYNSEHGAKVDDEINKIVAGGNYGWPEIAGYYDNKSYSYCNWSTGSCSENFSDHNCPTGATTLTEYQSFPSGAPANFQPPIGTYGSTVNSDPSGNWLTWPTVAPSSIDIYEAGLIPGWGKSLFITTLKEGTIFRAKLTPSGDDIEGDLNNGTKAGYEEFHSGSTRYRDIAFDPDGLTLYAVTDTSGTTSGPSGSSSIPNTQLGELIKIQYKGVTLSTDDAILNAFQVYPNPSSNGFIKVKMPNEISDFSISISNMLGQQLFAEKHANTKTEHNISTSNLKKGIYLVTVETARGKSTKKVVIQ